MMYNVMYIHGVTYETNGSQTNLHSEEPGRAAKEGG